MSIWERVEIHFDPMEVPEARWVTLIGGGGEIIGVIEVLVAHQPLIFNIKRNIVCVKYVRIALDDGEAYQQKLAVEEIFDHNGGTYTFTGLAIEMSKI